MNAATYLTASLIGQPRQQRRAAFSAHSAPTSAGYGTEFRTGMHTPDLERVLAKRELLALPDGNAKLVCLEGELWLTREGDGEDYILGPGGSFAIRHGDRAAVQALKTSRVRLVAA